MLVQAYPKEYYDKTQVEESSSSVVGNVEEAVPVEIGGINFEESNHQSERLLKLKMQCWRDRPMKGRKLML